jgi:hypothetical protein
MGLPVLRHLPCVHAIATTPVQQMGSDVAQTRPSISAFPVWVDGSACTLSVSRIAQRSLTLRPVRSHGHLCDRHPGASDISSPPCLPRLLPAGASPGGPLTHWSSATFHGAHPSQTFTGYFLSPRCRPSAVPAAADQTTTLARQSQNGRSWHKWPFAGRRLLSACFLDEIADRSANRLRASFVKMLAE